MKYPVILDPMTIFLEIQVNIKVRAETKPFFQKIYKPQLVNVCFISFLQIHKSKLQIVTVDS